MSICFQSPGMLAKLQQNGEKKSVLTLSLGCMNDALPILPSSKNHNVPYSPMIHIVIHILNIVWMMICLRSVLLVCYERLEISHPVGKDVRARAS